MAKKSQSALTTEITTLLHDNTSEDISPADIRTVLQDILDSTANTIDFFDSTQTYNVNDIVVQGGAFYKANKVTGPSTFTAADWTPLISFTKSTADTTYAPKGSPIATFNTADTYLPGDLVFQAGHIYRAQINVTPKAFDPTEWTQLTVDVADVTAQVASQERFQGVATTTPTTGEVDWTNIPSAAAANKGHYYISGEAVTVGAGPLGGTAVRAGDMVFSDGAAWHVVATGASGTGGMARSLADTLYAAIKHPVSPYSSTAAYAVGDQVLQNNAVWVCSSAIATGKAWDPTDWTAVGGAAKPPGILLWQANTAYPAGTVVNNSGYLYRYDDWGKGDPLPASATFNAGDWTQVGLIEGNPAGGPGEGMLITNAGELLAGNTTAAAGPFDRKQWVQASIPVWVNNVQYAVGAYVIRQDKLWKATSGTVQIGMPANSQLWTMGNWTASEWTQVLPDPTAGSGATTVAAVEKYDTTKTYTGGGELVLEQGKIYQSTLSGNPGAFAAANWTEIHATDAVGTLLVNDTHMFVKTPSGAWKQVLLDSPWGK